MNHVPYFLCALLIVVKCIDSHGYSVNASVPVKGTQRRIPPVKVGDKTFFLETLAKSNWFQAELFCQANGMRFASITSREENDEIVDAIKAAGYVDDFFWTSGNDLAEYGVFVWTSTGETFNSGYENWLKGQPDHTCWHNIDEVEHCVEIDANPGEWNDMPCSREGYFVCEHF